MTPMMRVYCLLAALLCMPFLGCAQSIAQDKSTKPHNGSLSQCFLDWHCDCAKCLHIRECIAEVTQEMVDARNGKEPNLSGRDREFIATVHKLEFLLKPNGNGPPLAPIHEFGERDPYARFKHYATRTDGKPGSPLKCGNCLEIVNREWNFCPECGTHVGAIEVILFPEGPEVRERGK